MAKYIEKTDTGGTGGTGGARDGSRSAKNLSNGDRIIRVLQICWLMQHSEVSVEQLADRFGVSRRTIFRDLRMIGAARLPLSIIRGEKGMRLVRVSGAPHFLMDSIARDPQ